MAFFSWSAARAGGCSSSADGGTGIGRLSLEIMAGPGPSDFGSSLDPKSEANLDFVGFAAGVASLADLSANLAKNLSAEVSDTTLDCGCSCNSFSTV